MYVGGSGESDSGETENNLKVGTIFEQLGKSLADGGVGAIRNLDAARLLY
jgi:hypothetical protein